MRPDVSSVADDMASMKQQATPIARAEKDG